MSVLPGYLARDAVHAGGRVIRSYLPCPDCGPSPAR